MWWWVIRIRLSQELVEARGPFDADTHALAAREALLAKYSHDGVLPAHMILRREDEEPH